MYADKLKKELAETKKGSRYVDAVKQPVFDALMNFCAQSAEFAQAVEQSSKTFADCCAAVVKGCGSCLSDIEAYRRAVDFYFPGAKVEFKMIIHMSEWEETDSANSQTSADTETKAPAGEIALDLFDLL